MSKSDVNIKKYLGYKFYKESEDGSFNIIRLIRISEFNDKVTIKDEETNKTKEVLFSSLKGYTPLIPYGKISFAQVKLYENGNKDKFVKDVIIAGYRDIDMKLELYDPYVVCRQNITDFWYNLIAQENELDENGNHQMVGVSTTRDNCPPNIPYNMMMLCDEMIKYEMISIYMNDTIESILECINVKEYDKILKELFDSHMKHINPGYNKDIPTKFDNKNGWCKNLSALLRENNFITDIDTMRGISAVEFIMEEFMTNDDENKDIYHCNNDLLKFFNSTFNLKATSSDVIQFDHDIDIANFNNTNYLLIRDKSNKLYIVVYKSSGEFLEKELEDKSNELSISDKLRLDFYNKYSNS